MDQLLADFLSRMGLALPVVILVAVRAGQMIHQMNSLNFKEKVNDLTLDILKQQITSRLEILYRVYKETSLDVVSNLPTEVNLHEVIDRLFDIELCSRYPYTKERIRFLNTLYCDLINQGTQSEYFLQVIQFISGGSVFFPCLSWLVNPTGDLQSVFMNFEEQEAELQG